MYVRERLRGGEKAHNDLREEESSSGGGETDSGELERERRERRGSMRRRHEVAEAPSLLTRAVGSVIKLVRAAEFEILFVSFFVLAVLLFKDLHMMKDFLSRTIFGYNSVCMILIAVRAILSIVNQSRWLMLTLRIRALRPLDPNTIKYWCKNGLKSRLGFTEDSMFRNTFQSGFLSIFYSLGSKPLQIWDTEAQNGTVKRCVDEDIQSNVLEILGTNVSSNYITCPADPRLTLGIKLPILVLIIKNMKKYFTFEVQVLDDKNVRRRFRVSNYQSVTRVKPYICTMPMRLDEGWNQIQLNLADFTRRAYGTNYAETLRVQVHANCRVRRIYFADRLYSEEELPPEFKIFLPIQKS